MKKIGFHSNQLCLRGTETALYTYAKYNEDILGNKSVIFSNPGANMDALDKFQARFDVHLLWWDDRDKFLKENNFDYFYTIQAGQNRGGIHESVPTLVHAVFRHNEPHGYRYRYVSDWLAEDQGYPKETYSVPHICEKLPDVDYNLRDELNIPSTSTVFGCYGGSTEFNIDWVHKAIIETVNNRNDIEFVFLNINNFYKHNQIHFLPGSYDLKYKSAFVKTCDAMIHARSGGETFGLAVSEFALDNKPVITYGLSGERAHLDIMKERAIVYNNYEEIKDILNNLNQHVKYSDYYLPYLDYSPEIVMGKFQKNFLS